jgi:hypothetical protein
VRIPTDNPRLQDLRSWSVVGLEAIRIYCALDEDALHIIRILHGKRESRGLVALQSRFAFVPAMRFVAVIRRLEPTQVLQQ